MIQHTNVNNEYEVCIVGAGPVGTYLAARLARAGIKVVVFEALAKLSDEPRAMTHVPVLFKEFGRAGILERMRQESAVHEGDISFRRTSDLERIETIKQKAGFPMPLILPQHKFTQLLLEEAVRFPNADIMFNRKFVKAEDLGDSVLVEVQDTTNESIHEFSCKYLVGADGSKSMVRPTLGTKYEGETLPFKLIAADVVFPFEQHGFDVANFLLDPEDFGMIAKTSKTQTGQTMWRVSTGFPIHMTDEEIVQAVPAKFQKLYSGLKPGTYETSRVTPYKTHQLSTTTMKEGRLLLIGDAAHLTNPYSGQSLASGIFDASSLAQCLVSIVKQGAPEMLLDEWNVDRLSKFKTFLDPLSRGCFAAVRDPDVESIGSRHPFLKAMKAGPGKGGPVPTLHTDMSKLKSWHSDGKENEEGAEELDLMWSKP